MYRIFEDGDTQNKWLDISDCTFRGNGQNYQIKGEQVIDLNSSENKSYSLNLNPKNIALFNFFAEKDNYDSKLTANDIRTLNEEFDVLRINNQKYDKSKEQERLFAIEEILHNLLSDCGDLNLRKVKSKNKKTLLKYKSDNYRINISIKNDKTTIVVKEKTWFFPKTLKTITIDNSSVESIEKDGNIDYSLVFDENTAAKKEEEPESVAYRSKEAKHTLKENESVEKIAEAWNIPEEEIKAANSPYKKDFTGATIKIPANGIYVVEEGDTYKSIARKLQVNRKELIEINKSYVLPKPGKKIDLPGEGKIRYMVQRDDSFESIAKKNGITVKELYDANPKLLTKTPLSADMEIKIPESFDKEYYEYTVKEGETFEDVARRHNVKELDLKLANADLADYEEITEGNQVFIPEYNHNLKVTKENVHIIDAYDYQVSEGETLIGLANDLDISPFVILAANTQLIKKDRKGNYLYDENKNLRYDIFKPGQIIKIPTHKKVMGLEKNDYLSVAKEVGVSESYILDILHGMEIGEEKLDPNYHLSPYDDGVSKIKDYNKEGLKKGVLNGTLTIGIGHTGRVNGKPMTMANWESISLTEDEVYVMLAQDIIKAKEETMVYFCKNELNPDGLTKEEFESIPLSIREALFDIAFNKGYTGFKRSESTNFLKDDIKLALETNDWSQVAEHTILRPTNDLGLARRNIYRIILACRDLPKETREKVMDNMQSYFDEVYEQFNNSDSQRNTRERFKKAWMEAKDNGWFEESVYSRQEVYKLD